MGTTAGPAETEVVTGSLLERTGHKMMTLSNQQKVEILAKMWLIRFFEEASIQLYGLGHYRGSTHPYIGQEATALGFCVALKSSYQVLATIGDTE